MIIEIHYSCLYYTSNFIYSDIPKETDSLPSKEQTVKEITDGEEIEATPLKRKKSSRNKENVIDGSEKKKRAKDSEEHKKSKGSKSASKKRNKSSKNEIQDEGLWFRWIGY